MSRPSTTTASAAATCSRCRATSSFRTAGTADTGDTARVTSAPRMRSRTSTPSTVTTSRRAFVPTRISASDTARATATLSSRLTPASSTATVAARYMAPVSRYAAPSRWATCRATLDFPVPDGPSRVTCPRKSLTVSPGRSAARSLRSSLVPRCDARSLGDVPSQGLGTAQVDVLDVVARLGHVDVRHQAQHPRQRVRHVHLGGAHQRDVAEAELAGGQCGELRDDVRGRGEQDADDVVVDERVALHDGGDQLTGGLEHLLPVVGVHLRGAPDGADGHALSFAPRHPGSPGAPSSLESR